MTAEGGLNYRLTVIYQSTGVIDRGIVEPKMKLTADMETLLLSVEPLDKATATWGNIKAAY